MARIVTYAPLQAPTQKAEGGRAGGANGRRHEKAPPPRSQIGGG